MSVLGKYYLHAIDENTEVQRGQKTCSRSHSKFMTETVAEHGSPDFLVFLHLHQRDLRLQAHPGRGRRGASSRGVRTAGTSQPRVETNDGPVFQIEIPIVDHRTCQEAYAPLKRKVTRDMICAGEKEGKSRGRCTTGHHQPWKGWRPSSLEG